MRIVDKMFVKVKGIIFRVIIRLLWNIHGEWYRPVTGLLACFKMVKLLPDFDLLFEVEILLNHGLSEKETFMPVRTFRISDVIMC